MQILLLFVFLEFIFKPLGAARVGLKMKLGTARAMGKRAGNTNTGEGGKGKKVRTTSDDAGEKPVNEKSKSTVGQCVSEKSSGGKLGATRTSRNPFEASRSEKLQYFVDAVKDKRTKNNNLEFLIGWAETLKAQTDSRRIALEKNTQRADIDEEM
jgi:hypothetical protein